MLNFKLTISFPALDRLVDFLKEHFGDQAKVDALTTQIGAIRAELNLSTATLAEAVAKQK